MPSFGTLKADTLTHSTAGSLATNYVVEGSSKAWADINNSGSDLRDSLNFSSIDDDGTGNYGRNYTNSMASANYSANMTLTFDHSSTNNARTCAIEGKTTSSLEVNSAYVQGTTTYFIAYDIETNGSVIVHGDLA